MKTRLCPHCQQPAINASVRELLTQSEYKCTGCEKSSRLSIFGQNLILFTFIAIAILAGNRLGYTVASIAVCFAALVIYLFLIRYWIPLVPTSPIYDKTERKQYKWYQAPVLWIGAFAALLIWWWQSLGLE